MTDDLLTTGPELVKRLPKSCGCGGSKHSGAIGTKHWVRSEDDGTAYVHVWLDCDDVFTEAAAFIEAALSEIGELRERLLAKNYAFDQRIQELEAIEAENKQLQRELATLERELATWERRHIQ